MPLLPWKNLTSSYDAMPPQRKVLEIELRFMDSHLFMAILQNAVGLFMRIYFKTFLSYSKNEIQFQLI